MGHGPAVGDLVEVHHLAGEKVEAIRGEKGGDVFGVQRMDALSLRVHASVRLGVELTQAPKPAASVEKLATAMSGPSGVRSQS